jgi:hypothetical protein
VLPPSDPVGAGGGEPGSADDPQFQFQFHTQVGADAAAGSTGSDSAVPVSQFQFQFHTHVWGEAGAESSAVVTGDSPVDTGISGVELIPPEFAP